MTANSFANNVMLFFVSDLKIVYDNNYYSSITMSWTREENILCHNLFSDKIIQNCLQIDATHYYYNDSLVRQETIKRLDVLEADIITIKKH